MAFTIVENYYRQEHFEFFSSFASPFYGLTFTVDITRAKAFAEKYNASIYLTLCYLAARAAQGLEDFRYRVRDGRIVRYDRLDISATLPVPNRLFSFAYFDYHPEITTFLTQADEVAQKARQQVSLGEREHFNQLLFTALPKVAFSHFTHPIRADRSDARPNIAFGRFTTDGDRLIAPVGLEVNHIFIDGNTLGDFVEKIQVELDHPQESP